MLARQNADNAKDDDPPRLFWLLLLLALLLAFRLLALHFAATDLFFDEAQYWTWSQQPAWGYYSKPPLIAWIIGLSTSLCGSAEFCIRLPSPIIHTATALLIYWLARRLYDARVGFWSALTFATLPGVSLSSGIISTDVPLLFAWALALLAFVQFLQASAPAALDAAGTDHSGRDGWDGSASSTGSTSSRRRGWGAALLLGFALGLGFNAKYAMVFFIICGGVYLGLTPRARRLLRDPRLYLAFAIAAAMIAPNIWWNASTGFATFSHTADNAKWGGQLLHPLKALEFFTAQFGVFGPILFGGLMVILWRAWREGWNEQDRLLAAFSFPIIAIITFQALLSRAHANWAATAYIAATPLVIAVMIRRLDWRWLKGSALLHGVIAVVIGVALTQAGKIDLPGKTAPFARTLGWRGVAAATRDMLDTAAKSGKPFAGIITDDRSLSAELLYYMRKQAVPLRAWRVRGSKPHDHYELTRPYRGRLKGPLLLVSRSKGAARIAKRFKFARMLADRAIPAGHGRPRRIKFYALSGYRGGDPKAAPTD